MHSHKYRYMKFRLWLENEENVIDNLSDVEGWQAVEATLSAAGVPYKYPQRLLQKVLLFNYNGSTYVIDDEGYPEPKEAYEWVQERSWRGDIHQYIPESNFNDQFWTMGSNMPLYHGTTDEDWEQIQTSGKLQPKDRTRGINNRSTGAAIFTSSEYDTAIYHYSVVLEIDVPSMKRDGYMPRVSQESPVEEATGEGTLANAIGLEDYQTEWESGIDEGTVIFYDDIPLQYVTRVK